MGVLLVQLPGDQARDDARLGWLLDRMSDHAPEVRIALELRHDSWQDETVFAVLEHLRAAYVVLSGAHLATRCATPERSRTGWAAGEGE